MRPEYEIPCSRAAAPICVIHSVRATRFFSLRPTSASEVRNRASRALGDDQDSYLNPAVRHHNHSQAFCKPFSTLLMARRKQFFVRPCMPLASCMIFFFLPGPAIFHDTAWVGAVGRALRPFGDCVAGRCARRAVRGCGGVSVSRGFIPRVALVELYSASPGQARRPYDPEKHG